MQSVPSHSWLDHKRKRRRMLHKVLNAFSFLVHNLVTCVMKNGVNSFFQSPTRTYFVAGVSSTTPFQIQCSKRFASKIHFSSFNSHNHPSESVRIWILPIRTTPLRYFNTKSLENHTITFQQVLLTFLITHQTLQLRKVMLSETLVNIRTIKHFSTFYYLFLPLYHTSSFLHQHLLYPCVAASGAESNLCEKRQQLKNWMKQKTISPKLLYSLVSK